MSLWSRLASLVRSPAGPGRALDPDKGAINKGFSLQKKTDLKLLKFEDECAQTLLESQMQKRFHEQNMRMSKVKNQKSLLLQKLERELNINKSVEELHAEKIRYIIIYITAFEKHKWLHLKFFPSPPLLFKYMNHGVVVVAIGALLGSLLTTPRLHPQMESLGKALCHAAEEETNPRYMSG